MKLTLKCLIDFRSWLSENYDMKIHEFTDLPEFVQNAYMMEFFIPDNQDNLNRLIDMANTNYNNNFQKILDEHNDKSKK